MRVGNSCHVLRHRAVVLGVVCLALSADLAAQTWEEFEGPAGAVPEAIGRYAGGCLAGAERLSPDGPGYQAIRLSRNRHYGHPELVRFVRDLGRRAAAAGIGLLPVGDMSQPRGGPMIQAHASHQIGLDVDVFFDLDLPALAPAAREDLNLPSFVAGMPQRVEPRFSEPHFELVRLAASDARVARVFVHPAIKRALCERDWQDRSFLRTVRPWYGHDDHMHVRLRCPPASADCVDQAAPPPGDGCGEEIDAWLDGGEVPDRPPAERRMPSLPSRCAALR